MSMLTFRGRVITGAGRGKELNAPTLNIDLSDVPKDFKVGIYACFVTIDESTEKYQAALHYGPRLVFDGSVACEAHLLDTVLASRPSTVSIEIIERLRDVQNFPSVAELMLQIEEDVKQARRILSDISS